MTDEPPQGDDRGLEPVRIYGAPVAEEERQRPGWLPDITSTELWERLSSPPWPLVGVLVVQAALSLRLIWGNTAFNDEALYLWAGHWEIAHLLYGVKIPQFPTFIAGAPVVYPVVGAIADSYGGLAAARLLSLAFMLASTTLLYLVAGRLFGQRAALYGAAIFAVLGPVQFLGSYATYDAMAVFCLALAAFCAVRAQGRLSEPLLIASALALALGDATKYATALWNPVVIAIAGLTAERGGPLRAVARSGRLALYVGVLILLGLHAGGQPYLRTILDSTVVRHAATVPALAILRDSAEWIGLAVLVAARSVIVAPDRRTRLLCLTLTGAALLAPLNQARIHTSTSLDKHVAYGAWFAAVAAGFVLAQAVASSKYATWRIAAGTTAAVAVVGVFQASAFATLWPNTGQAISVIQRVQSRSRTALLAEQGAVVDYYLKLPPTQLANTFAWAFWDPRSGRELRGTHAYARAIHEHVFGLVEVDYSFTARLYRDRQIVRAVQTTAGYQLIADLPWRSAQGHGTFMIWRYMPVAGRGPKVRKP